jgi:hypothetical protein
LTVSVSVAATDRSLATAAEVLAALGETVTAAMILYVSDLISLECRVVGDGVNPPTLREETIVETIRVASSKGELILSRRFIGDVASVTVDGSALAETEYEVDPGSGILTRIDSTGAVICWNRGKVVVTYDAGFAVVPETLKLAAIRVIQEQLSASARDPLLRGETVEGIGRFDYWVNGGGASASGPISGAVSAMLDPYRSIFA